MNTILKLLYVVAIPLLLVSCGGNDEAADAPRLENTLAKDNKITEILTKKSVMYGKAESFECVSDPLSESFSIHQVVLFTGMTCATDPKLCEEISSFIGGNKLVFRSSEEYALIEEESPEYRMMQKGTIVLNDNDYSGTLYYSGEGKSEAGAWFHGKLIFELPAVKSLKGAPLIIEIKGRK